VTHRRTAVALVAVVALSGAATAVAAAPKPKIVKVADNYFQPDALTVKPDTVVKWKWPSDMAIDVHDAKLKSAPKGVKKWHSEPASSGYTYKRTFKKVGTYKIVCTLHEEMKMTVKVKD